MGSEDVYKRQAVDREEAVEGKQETLRRQAGDRFYVDHAIRSTAE